MAKTKKQTIMKKLLTTLIIVFAASTVMGQTKKLDSNRLGLLTNINNSYPAISFNPKTTARIQFHSDSLGVYMAFWDNGNIYHLGKKLTTDVAIVNGLKAVFRGQIDSLKNEIHKRNQIIAHKQMIIEKIDKVIKNLQK